MRSAAARASVSAFVGLSGLAETMSLIVVRSFDVLATPRHATGNGRCGDVGSSLALRTGSHGEVSPLCLDTCGHGSRLFEAALAPSRCMAGE